jgi:shikimate kinase
VAPGFAGGLPPIVPGYKRPKDGRVQNGWRVRTAAGRRAVGPAAPVRVREGGAGVHKNIILTGFMGTGKTTVGQILAAELQRPFVDIDEVIRAREGRDISAIFAAEGEAYFRSLERRMLAATLLSGGQVIATGGGAVLHSRDLLEAGGILLCLTASPGELAGRLRAEGGRPLLAGDPEGRIAALLAERQALYDSIPRQISTEGKTPRQVAAEILALLTGGEEI